MENYDAQKAARVWQRVQNSTQGDSDAAVFAAMVAEEQTDAVTYLHLSRRYQGKEAASLRRLFEEEQSHAACLKGIYTLITGQRIPSRSLPTPTEPTGVILRRCYGREMRALAQYEAWMGHREYGPVFQRLARQEQEHCRILLELLGKLKS